MTPLTYTGRARLAALHLLAETPLLFEITPKSDDGTLLVVEIPATTWERLSSGQRALAEVLEQMAGRVSTVTLYEIGNRVDERALAQLVRAYAIYFGVEAEVAA